MVNLKEFVSSFNLENYETRLREQGYDCPMNLYTLDEADLTGLEIRDEGTRRRILDSVNSLDIRPWLKLFSLERFYDDLKACGVATVAEMKAKAFTEEAMDGLDILQAGCRKRLVAAVNLLRGSRVIAEGYWARPETLSLSPHEFLCIDGHLRGESGLTSEPIVFMVDTGSDMAVTTQPAVIKELQLPLKGRVDSRGAHAAKKMDLYSATLVIGGHEMQVEVMPDSHDSVGNTVVRQFRHHIDSSSHKWILDADG